MKENRWDERCYIVILFFLNGFYAATVTWKRITDPIVFGSDVILKCFPENFTMNYLRQWKRGRHILTYDEIISAENRNKYAGSVDDDGFILIIKDFQPEDFRQNYTCSYDFDIYTANLTTENYRCNPGPGSYNVDVNSSLSLVEVNITFQKIYPIPQCKIYLHQRELEAKSENSFSAVDTYCLGLTMTLTYEFNLFECGEEVSVSCIVGNSSFFLKKLPILRTCEAVCLQMSPCLNNGTCMHDGNNVSCDCTVGYYGQRCEHFENPTTITSTKAEPAELLTCNRPGFCQVTDPSDVLCPTASELELFCERLMNILNSESSEEDSSTENDDTTQSNNTTSSVSTTLIVIITISLAVGVGILVYFCRRKFSPTEKECGFLNSTICCKENNDKESRVNVNGNSSNHNEQGIPMLETACTA